ncbi:hypothetical protein PARPLA_02861 [Rhodobacteraceae bacterium THAF1]|uniref:gene transfer agent family protein n=1 Tax=Palleronia sp. THAF1 TaxID=2587842 RepID=UPI000F3FDEFF|nr:gene transfer agent family protein [Palleronia sp. THAF1]QFU08263.1 hypothetical protein FIU81_06215 [Palleronia sp. THAF1]VDC28837.1 hypothetical protein PARPLA_02861 [Rhodobacteraceae bacterium THAF1]
MANPHAGEVDITLDGTLHTARLTLGALAELEASMQADSLVALVARFEGASYTTRDVIALLVAGLRGGGWHGTTRDLLHARIDGGPLEAARAAALLLGRAFG